MKFTISSVLSGTRSLTKRPVITLADTFSDMKSIEVNRFSSSLAAAPSAPPEPQR